MSFVVVFLEVSEVVQHSPHYELVEEDDTQKGYPGQHCGESFFSTGSRRVFLSLLNGLN
jgi:hypothetical protein